MTPPPTTLLDLPQVDPAHQASVRATLLEFETLDREVLRRKKELGIRYYVPNTQQYKAHCSHARTILYVGGNRAGKCLPLTTPVLMANGIWKPLSEVCVGEWVVGDGEPTQVTGLATSGDVACYRIRFSDGGEVIASANHLFPIALGSGRNITKRCLGTLLTRKSMSVSKRARFFSPTTTKFLTETPLPIDPYLLGVLIGDGSLVGNYTLTSADPNIVARINRLLSHYGRNLHQGAHYSYNIVGAGHHHDKFGRFLPDTFREQLKSLGVCHTAHDKRIPDQYLFSSDSNREKLLAGLIDTDGAVDEYATVSQQLAEQVRFLIKSLGGKATLQRRITHCNGKPFPSYRIYWRMNRVLPLSRPDKQAWTKRLPNYTSRIVRSIEPTGMLPCGDLEVADSKHTFVSNDWVLTGNSTFGAVELAMHLTREYPDWFPMERRVSGPIKAVVVATEFPIVLRVIEPKLMAYLPKESIAKLSRTPQGHLSRVWCKDGSTVDILTNEMSQLAFESADWDFAWIDEPTQRAKYVAIRRGLVDRGGRCVITFTPIIEPWMKAELVDQSDGKAIEAFTVDIRDNMVDIQGQTIQTEENIADFERVLTEDEKQTRLHGHFFHLRGIVYNEFTSGIHERLLVYAYPDPVVCVLDPHTRKPHHVIWAVIRRDDSIYVDRELVTPGTLSELSKKILLTEQMAGYKMRRRLIDPNFGRTPNLVTGRSVIDELRRPPYPVAFGEADDDKEAGILKIRELLHWDHLKPIDLLNTPRLFFHPRCVNTIRSIRNYQFDDWRGAGKEDRDLKEVDKQKDTDGADVVRYLCLSNPSFDRLTHRNNQTDLEEALY